MNAAPGHPKPANVPAGYPTRYAAAEGHTP